MILDGGKRRKRGIIFKIKGKGRCWARPARGAAKLGGWCGYGKLARGLLVGLVAAGPRRRGGVGRGAHHRNSALVVSADAAEVAADGVPELRV